MGETRGRGHGHGRLVCKSYLYRRSMGASPCHSHTMAVRDTVGSYLACLEGGKPCHRGRGQTHHPDGMKTRARNVCLSHCVSGLSEMIDAAVEVVSLSLA